MAALALLHQPAPAGVTPPTIAWRSCCSFHRCTPKLCIGNRRRECTARDHCWYILHLLSYCMQASAAALGFEARQSLRGNTAKAVGLPLRFVTLERISSTSIGGHSSMNRANEIKSNSGRAHPGLEVELHVRLGADGPAGEELMRKPQVPLGFKWFLLCLSTCASLHMFERREHRPNAVCTFCHAGRSL